MSSPNVLAEVKDKFSLLSKEAEAVIRGRCEVVCALNQWQFSSLFGSPEVRHKTDGRRIEETELHRLVYEYMEMFGNFPEFAINAEPSE